MDVASLVSGVRADAVDPDLISARRFRERAEVAESALRAEKRRVHWLRVAVFMAVVILTAGAAAVTLDRPAFHLNHARATIAEVVETMQTHQVPLEREQAIKVGAMLTASFLDALHHLTPRTPLEARAREDALRALEGAIRAHR